MKPLTFKNLRRLMGGGRKKKEKESSFKRSDSFKRISIRKSYLDRGKKKVIPKLEVATQTVDEEELINQIPEEEVKKVDSSVQVDKADLNATIKSGKEIISNFNRKPNSPERTASGNSVVAYSQWLKEIRKEDAPTSPSIKGSERTIIYVPASDEKVSSPVIRQLSSSPVFRKKNNTTTTHICNNSFSNLHRKESNDSAVEMFPWGDSTEVKKSPLIRRRSRQSSASLLPSDSGTEEMCSLSISLGRVWMDAPQAMAPRSLEMPKLSSGNAPPPAHHSLDSALKDLRDDPLVSNRLQKRSPPVTRTLSSTSNNTTSTGLFSSKDSGFSFSISAPKLSDFHANFAPNGSKGFFRKKSRPKPKLSVSKDGYFKRTSGALVLDVKRSSIRRSSKKKKGKTKKNKTKEKDNGTIRSDIYQVVVSRPQRTITALKLDPMIFVPPEKRKNGSQKPLFKTQIQEIRNFNPFDSNMYSTSRSIDSTDEGLYESLPGDYEYLTDDEEINLESFSMEKNIIREEQNVQSEVKLCGCSKKNDDKYNATSGYGVVRKYCKREKEFRKEYGAIEIYTEEKVERRLYQPEVQKPKNVQKGDEEVETHRYHKNNSDLKNFQKSYHQHLYHSKTNHQTKDTILNSDLKKDSSDPRTSYREPRNNLENFSEEDSLVSGVSDNTDNSNNSSDIESDDQCVNIYVPPGVSPVPRRRPVRRKKSTGLSHKRSITYLVKPTVIRAPSTLRRPAKKIGKKSKQSKHREHDYNSPSNEENAQDP